ncbi:hypothetical protein GCM10009678_81050 [Actinomadura kijaniata]
MPGYGKTLFTPARGFRTPFRGLPAGRVGRPRERAGRRLGHFPVLWASRWRTRRSVRETPGCATGPGRDGGERLRRTVRHLPSPFPRRSDTTVGNGMEFQVPAARNRGTNAPGA